MFRSFVLHHHFRPTTEAVFAFFTILASRQRTRSLQSISLMPDWVDMERHHFAPGEFDELAMCHHLSYDALRPLTSLCRFRELIINLGRLFSIDDDDLVSLTRNWPLLQVLHLSCSQYVHGYPWQSVKYVTFKGLLSLLECCPDLHDPCLPLDAREVPVNTGDIICNVALTYIQFPDSPIGDPCFVEEILTRHFPSVREVFCSFTLPSAEDDPEIEPYISSWDEVNTYLLNTHYPDHDDPDS